MSVAKVPTCRQACSTYLKCALMKPSLSTAAPGAASRLSTTTSMNTKWSRSCLAVATAEQASASLVTYTHSQQGWHLQVNTCMQKVGCSY